MTIYADTSFLISKYLSDVHSAEADHRMMGRPEVWLSQLNRVEMANAIYRSVFHGRGTLADARLIWDQFEEDCERGVWIEVALPEGLWRTSIDLARRHGPTLGVRTLDSLHVACALELKSRQFWTFDERQARLAETVGLATRP
ncbi:MAG TPA: type II toxin-antitoxin system VapC family toxin [Terracidiphilus sp.]|nr:type II toxin-antitoxin system VapC family toxin [Terracidiphilus sp.]